MISARLRGQPLALLIIVIGGWAALRVLTWQPPQWPERQQLRAMLIAAEKQAEATATMQAEIARPYVPISVPLAYGGLEARSRDWQGLGAMDWRETPHYASQRPVQVMISAEALQSLLYSNTSGMDRADRLVRTDDRTLMEALARAGVLPATAAYGGQSIPTAPAPVPLSPGAAQGAADRWSADAWMLLRRENRLALASGRPVYGGSQSGAVLRYHLAPQSPHRPIAYLRASQAMGGIRQSEAALGFGVRPLAGLPVTVAAEGRVFNSLGRTTIRPAALAYTELPPINLPLGFRSDTYLQGGYVGGSFKTPFIDGLMRIDRELASPGGTELRLGGGIWGGAQKGARRFDVGPSASASVDLMGVPSRVSMDWRFRVMGDAEPKSGPAVTMSAGF